MIRILILCSVLALPAAARDRLPALFDVSNVAADDQLNIRQSPTAKAAVIAVLSPDARNIEVISQNNAGTWGLINSEEQSGWVSLSFLTRQPGQGSETAPQIRRCFGTEPFWSLALSNRSGRDVADYASPATPKRIYEIQTVQRSANRIDRFSFHAQAAEGTMTGVIGLTQCSDGMSDRHYGITIDLLRQTASGPSHASGCCSLAP